MKLSQPRELRAQSQPHKGACSNAGCSVSSQVIEALRHVTTAAPPHTQNLALHQAPTPPVCHAPQPPKHHKHPARPRIHQPPHDGPHSPPPSPCSRQPLPLPLSAGIPDACVGLVLFAVCIANLLYFHVHYGMHSSLNQQATLGLRAGCMHPLPARAGCCQRCSCAGCRSVCG